jgi:hypothetical protein
MEDTMPTTPTDDHAGAVLASAREAAELRQLHEATECAREIGAVLCKLQQLAYDGVAIPPKTAALVADALAGGAVAFYAWAEWLQAGCPS